MGREHAAWDERAGKSRLEELEDLAVGMVAVWWLMVFVLWVYLLFAAKSDPLWLIPLALWAFSIRAWWLKRRQS